MKKIILFLLLTFSTTIIAQTEKYAGNYEAHFDFNHNGVITYTLILKPDGTFTFHNYRKISAKNPEENSYGQGTWKVEKENVLYFHTDANSDLDDKYTIDFTNTKARYYTKSPRDKSDKIVKTKLKFFESDIPWIKGWELFKQ
ncbi:MAG: hypothetical protein COB12_03560 [Flavobacterium sp.]|nr:MAG: hypothetical protein COB12_03560 [Flavobacterium sp.]